MINRTIVRSNLIKMLVLVLRGMSTGEPFEQYCHEVDRRLDGDLREYMLYTVGLDGLDDGCTYDSFEDAVPYGDTVAERDFKTLTVYDLLEPADGEEIMVLASDGLNTVLDNTRSPAVEETVYTVTELGEQYIEHRDLDRLKDSLKDVIG